MEHGEPSGIQANNVNQNSPQNLLLANQISLQKVLAMDFIDPKNKKFITEDKFLVSSNLSTVSRETFMNIKEKKGRGPEPGCKRYVHDNNSPGYDWLLLGWVAEERVVSSGRLYRYYYDPSGRLYRTRHEVRHAWEKSGLILIDM